MSKIYFSLYFKIGGYINSQNILYLVISFTKLSLKVTKVVPQNILHLYLSKMGKAGLLLGLGMTVVSVVLLAASCVGNDWRNKSVRTEGLWKVCYGSTCLKAEKVGKISMIYLIGQN